VPWRTHFCEQRSQLCERASVLAQAEALLPGQVETAGKTAAIIGDAHHNVGLLAADIHLATILRLLKPENARKTPATPLSALINQQNNLRVKGMPGQQYDLTSTWATNVNAALVATAKAAGACQQ
jgi:hypothetical protein